MRYIFILLTLFTFSSVAQPLRDINYKYLYNPAESFVLNIQPVMGSTNCIAYYHLKLKDSTNHLGEFRIQWELRNGLIEKDGKVIHVDSLLTTNSPRGFSSNLVLPTPSAQQVLVAKVMNTRIKRAWMFYEMISSSYPVDGILKQGDVAVSQPYIKAGQSVTVASDTLYKTIYYYNDNFPAASPAFAEAVGRVSKGMDVDSTFSISTTQPLQISKKGLYLVQDDSSSLTGFAFRVEDDYPRFAKFENISHPLIYICTKQEFERIKASKGEKKAFDRVILSITGDTERAKTLMRNYFRRVEQANEFFTSYKEGWKTDRGMIYIIFGAPDDVFKFADREVWNYRNTTYKVEFEFAKSSTVFDPENFVLLRQKKYQETWYEVIDLWRNARF